MRILVYELASGGGYAGRPVPRTLAREGRAMLTALVADLAAIDVHQIVTTTDPRFTLDAPPGVRVVTLGRGRAALPNDLLSSVDAVWPIAPETDGCLERLAAAIERSGKMLLGTGPAAIRRAADKARLPQRLARCGVAHPRTYVLDRPRDARALANRLGYPIVVKPSRGAGCCGVSLVRNWGELRAAVDAVKKVAQPWPGSPPRGLGAVGWSAADAGLKPCPTLLLQHYAAGVPASVSLLCDGRRAMALSLNAQAVRAGSPFSYRGGCTPLDHPLAERAIDAAIRTCQAFPNLRGYVGVDLVLSRGEAVVIEVNPRLTTAYLGVRSAIDGGDGNIAAMAIEACRGRLPAPPQLARRVRFSASGRVAQL